MSAYSVKITGKAANIWQSCTLCSRNLDESYIVARNLTTDSYFTICTPCLETMADTLADTVVESKRINN